MESHPGLYLEQLRLTGPHQRPKAIALTDGVNVLSKPLAGDDASVVALVEYVLCGSRWSARDGAAGFERVGVILRDRATKEALHVERSFAGVGAKVDTVDERGSLQWSSTSSAASLSALLLARTGFPAARLRRNRLGETRELRFQDVAFLAMCDASRLASNRALHISGHASESTVENEVLRYVVTGEIGQGEGGAAQTRLPPSQRAQLELVHRLLTEREAALESTNVARLGRDEIATALAEGAPPIAGGVEAMRAWLAQRDALVRAEAIHEELARFRELEATLTNAVAPGAQLTEADGAFEALEREMRALFASTAPDERHALDYASARLDIRIDELPRSSAPAEVRDRAGFAFVAGLMRHCARRGLPHPGFVLVESPHLGEVARAPERIDAQGRQMILVV